MSTTQQQKKKSKKSYAQLLEECSSFNNKIAAVYIPQLCEAYRDENPDKSYDEIRDKVFIDCRELGWGGKTGSTIYHNYPSWLIEDNPDHKRVKKNWETRNANILKSSADRLKKVTEQIPEPPQLQQKEITEEQDQQMHELGIAKFGDSDKSIRELKGDITDSAAKLFEALTQKHIPYDDDEDLIVDYIKPTREFRRSLSLELDETARTTIYNWLHYTSAAIEDMMQIISEVKDK